HRESPPLLFDADLPLALLDLLVLGSEGSGGDGYVDLDRGLSLGLDFKYHTICRRICQGKPSADIGISTNRWKRYIFCSTVLKLPIDKRKKMI
ncbi:MAG: hypothetical protein IKV66_06420, partial [Clostridia bacterium]|nr:hypothetical protein [Clostridia bacterium]